MLHLDTTGTLGKSITPSHGIPEHELSALHPSLKRYTEAWVKERREGKHAWADAPYDDPTIQRVKECAAALKKRAIHTIVWIGIGGSSLGPKVIQEIFETVETMEFLLIDTLDPGVLRLVLPLIDWRHTTVVIASKSGDTLEPMSTFSLFWHHLKKHREKRAKEHVIAITDPNQGGLRNFCTKEGIVMLPIHPDIGGRYSIFTPIGLLPLALLGGSLERFLRGAKGMDILCQKTSPLDNPALLLAATQFLLNTKRDYLLRVIMPYSQRLRSLALWDQQLVAESLGKNELHNPIPIAAVGPQDQHSLLQQWMAGPRKAWHLFIREEEKPELMVPPDALSLSPLAQGKTFSDLLDACADGTAKALMSAKRPSALLRIDRLDEEHLGQLFFFFMTETIFLGKLYRIDPYGQPAVEVGKKMTKEILSKV